MFIPLISITRNPSAFFFIKDSLSGNFNLYLQNIDHTRFNEESRRYATTWGNTN